MSHPGRRGDAPGRRPRPGVRGRRRGAQAVELALLLPAFVAFVAGIFEYSYVWYHQTAALDAARTACRAAATVPGRDREGARATAEAEVEGRLDAYGVGCVAPSCEVTLDWLLEPPREVLSCRVRSAHRGLTGVLPHPDAVGATVLVPIEVQR